MTQDKYTAVWVSHSSISDFLNCPRAYFLKNVYKDPKTGRKISTISPPLALGQAVHEVLESLSILPTDNRFAHSLSEKLETVWKKLTGKRGGFTDKDQESHYKQLGLSMLAHIKKNPGPLVNLAVKIKMDLPHYWLSETDNIILCGKIDWLEYLPEEEAVHIIDFKTGKSVETKGSLQLPIYHLLVDNCQHHKVKAASYWYLRQEAAPTSQTLPSLKKAHQKILKIAKRVKLARQLNRFPCPNKTGCKACKPLQTNTGHL